MIMFLDRWMVLKLSFISLLTVFQSYHDDGRMTMKGPEEWLE